MHTCPVWRAAAGVVGHGVDTCGAVRAAVVDAVIVVQLAVVAAETCNRQIPVLPYTCPITPGRTAVSPSAQVDKCPLIRRRSTLAKILSTAS